MITTAIQIYILSGFIMIIGAYLTYKYQFYCTLKSPVREDAMILHRKKLLELPMTNQENKQLTSYLLHANIASFGSFLIIIFGLVHILLYARIFDFSLSPLYYLSTLCILPIVVINGHQLPTCCQPFPAIILWKSKNEHLESLNVYYKKREGIELNEGELNIHKMEEFSLVMFFIYKYMPIIGVILFSILDIWYGLNGVFR